MSDIEKNDLLDEETEMEENFITLINEDGDEEEFEIDEIFEVDGKEYIVIVPLEADEDAEEEALLFRLENDPETDEDVLLEIEDDEEWDKVAAFYMGMDDDEE